MLTHWFYLYIPWFFPFARLLALVAPRREPADRLRIRVAHGAGRGRRAVARAPRSCRLGVLHVGFYEREQIVDTPVYESYGEAIADGEVPYRDFAVEYPPGALPVFLVPALARRRTSARVRRG